MLKRIFITFSLGLVLFASLFACKTNQKDINIANIEVQAPLYRFDELFTQLEPITTEQWQRAEASHPAFTAVFAESILGESPTNITTLQEFQNYFSSDSIAVSNLIKTEFKTLPEYNNFVDMQKRFKKLLPSYHEVGMTTMLSGFNYKNMLLQDQLAVGLELYLGNKIEYEQLGELVNDYQTHRFERSYIVPDAATAIVNDMLEDRGEFNTFLKKIIYEGKKLYLKEQVLPTTPPEKLIGLTPEAYDWCEANEQMIWQYFVREELLYNNDIHRWKTYVFDGPFSAGMPESAPALTGNFIGWQIVKSYMKNTDTSINELLQDNDAVNLFKTAKYVP